MRNIYKLSLFLLIFSFSACFTKAAQKDVSVYKTFIYTSSDLADEIQRVNDQQDDTRRFDVDLLNATLGAVKGIGSGYVSAFIDLGVNAIGNLITRNARLQQEWEETVKKENTWSTTISSVQDVKDFYRKPSTAGALDPLNMNFDGIGCMRLDGNDTVFFVSCHIDRSKLNRIVNHSKFELVLDTLILSPEHSNLPNTQLPLTYSFDERGKFNLSMNIKLTSSWFTDAIELHNDALLGEFNINVPVQKNDVDSLGFIRYYRSDDEPSKYAVVGESFIVPRSYMGYRDSDGRYNNIWGTGQYKLDIEIKETCEITPTYRDNWKADRKMRNKLKPSKGFFPTVWQTVSSQHWDEITKSWVITTLKAPAGIITKELINQIGLGGTTGGGQGSR
ncbi:MAG: hypothetical protein J1F20_07500 [Muribaculaceae bacterium]|nr:hypothetical protein [Muribaculaceae bacterium]